MKNPIALAALLLAASFASYAADRVETVNKNRSSLALKGYDPVGYFTLGRPVKRLPQFTHKWMDATWQFASAEARDAFASQPQKYVPQYGGYCAWAVSRGYTADTDPEAWKIVAGRLYLNYSKAVQKQWETDVAGNIAKADANWPSLHR